MKDFASEIVKLPEVNFPIVAYFDEKFNLYETEQGELLKLMEHFDDYKSLADLDAALDNLKYAVDKLMLLKKTAIKPVYF